MPSVAFASAQESNDGTVAGLRVLLAQIDELIRAKEIQSRYEEKNYSAYLSSKVPADVTARMDASERARLEERVATSIALREAKNAEELVVSGSDEGTVTGGSELRVESNLAFMNQTLIEAKIMAMRPEFRKKMEYVSLTGTQEEKAVLRGQLQDYLTSNGTGREQRLASSVSEDRVNPSEVIAMLDQNRGLEEIIGSIGG